MARCLNVTRNPGLKPGATKMSLLRSCVSFLRVSSRMFFLLVECHTRRDGAMLRAKISFDYNQHFVWRVFLLNSFDPGLKPGATEMSLLRSCVSFLRVSSRMFFLLVECHTRRDGAMLRAKISFDYNQHFVWRVFLLNSF